MSKYSEIIEDIKPFDYSEYESISSREKLIVFTMDYLKSKGVPLTFNYICIGAFKLFPEKFYFSEEFNSYPHIEMLNRTILHLRPKERNYASGSVRNNYELTPLGAEIAKEVRAEIQESNSLKPKKSPKLMDEHKQDPEIIYHDFTNSELYSIWEKNHTINEMDIWSYFDVTPYTQTEKIKLKLEQIKNIAKDKQDQTSINLILEIKNRI